MNLFEYMHLLYTYQSNRDERTKKAIEEQIKLGNIALEKRKNFDVYNERSKELIKEGSKKLFAKYPDLEAKLNTHDIKLDQINYILQDAINTTSDYKEITSKMKEFEEFKENEPLNDKVATSFMEYVEAFTNLNHQINNDRKNLFTEAYLTEMSRLADEGILLYYLETPDLPLLVEKIDGELILESFLINECMNLRILLSSFTELENPSPSMSRKIEDLKITIELINLGYYRTAARNLFALIESEHKKCADGFEGIVAKRRIYKNGFQRANKISKLLDNVDIDWYRICWEKVNSYYSKIVKAETVDGIINRNAIVHGDYFKTILDVDKYAAVKLLLVWLNLRIISDYICNVDEIYDIYLSFLPSIIYCLLNK